MATDSVRARIRALLIGSFAFLVTVSCGKSDAPPAAPAATEPSATAATPAASEPPGAQPLQASAAIWTPEALEDLLAPVALYPDPVLAQLLVATTNPQEVLDAGNWLIANANLKGKPLDAAAEKVGFTLPMRGLMQFPDVIDQLCLNMGWTEELGQAYVNDQAGVMDAVQRLRVQAKDVGTLQSSQQLKVETTQQEGEEVITVTPPDPKVVYVPQYDPIAAYAAPSNVVVQPGVGATGVTVAQPAAGTTNVIVNQPAAATTTTTTTTESDNSSLVATGLLAFGAGLLVGEIFDDDDDYWGSSYYGGMYGRPMPPYPAYPYRPAYGGGYYPGNSYNRPPNYNSGRQNNGNININVDNDKYYGRYGNDASVKRNRTNPSSPISAARPNRPELDSLNSKAARGPERKAPTSSDAWKGKGSYAGADPKTRAAAGKPAARTTPASGARPTPKLQGGYAGATPTRERDTAASRPTAPARDAPRPATRDTARPAAQPARPPSAGSTDRGRVADAGRPAPSSMDRSSGSQRAATPAQSTPSPSRPTPQARPAAAAPRPSPAANTAFSGGGSGGADRAASARGHQSMPAGGAAKARGGGGGGGGGGGAARRGGR